MANKTIQGYAAVLSSDRTVRLYFEDLTCLVVMQPSGRCLIEGRTSAGWMSRYEEFVVEDCFLNNRMYGGSARYALTNPEVKAISEAANWLRETFEYDPSYAPSRYFTGDEHDTI